MAQVVGIGVSQTYTSVALWIASSDYSDNHGAGNPATGEITGILTEVVTFNTTTTPNGAHLTAKAGEEYDGTNSATCAGITSAGITLALRDPGLEISNIFVETTANGICIRPGAFEGVDSDIHDVGCKAGLTGDASAGIETYSGAPFTGNLVNFVVEASGGYGIRLRAAATGTLDHLTVVDVCGNGSGFRDGIVGVSTDTIITNALVLLASSASGSAESFSGTFSTSADFNAGDDTTAPGSNSEDNRTTADLADFAGGDFRTAKGSLLATEGSGGGFIGAFLEPPTETTEDLAPDALIASIGFSSCTNSDLDSIDANFCVATNDNTSTETHNSFGTPTGIPTTGVDLQQMRCEVRLTSGSGTGTPTARIEVWESGVLVTAGSEIDVTSSSSQIITLDWDAVDLTTADGSGVEIKVFGTKTGGSPAVRSAVDVGFVEWIATIPLAGLNLAPTGIASTESIGSPTITTGSVDLSPTGIASTESIGSPVVAQPAEEQFLTTTGIASAESIGTPVLTTTVDLAATGIPTAESLGSPVITVGAVDLSTTGIASVESFGAPVITQDGGTQELTVTGIASQESIGSPVLTTFVTISATGIASVEAFGAPTITTGGVTLTASGIASEESIGSPVLTTGAVNLTTTGISSAESFGSPVVTIDGGTQFLNVGGIASTESFGATTVSPGAVDLATTGIASVESLGSPTITTSVVLAATGIGSTESIGTPVVNTGAVNLAVTGIPSEEAFGSPTVAAVVAQNLTATGIASQESFGNHVLVLAGDKLIKIDFANAKVLDVNLASTTVYYNGENYFTI